MLSRPVIDITPNQKKQVKQIAQQTGLLERDVWSELIIIGLQKKLCNN